MLLFSTVLDIHESLTQDAFINLVLEWNRSSKYSSNIIPGIEWHGERNIRYGKDGLWLDIEEYRNQNIIAVRYEKKGYDGAVWDTDYVMNFNAGKMAVRLDRSYTQDALTEDQRFSTPHFITLLIENGYLKADEDLPVMRTPVMIDNSRLEQLADIITGRKQYHLPVVYVSRTYYDEEPFDVKVLAGRLKGAAHVLVQESISSNPKLRELCGGANEYYGAVGIYYPNPAIGRRRLLYRRSEGADPSLLEKVFHLVVQYSNSQMIDTLYTWQGVNNAILRDRLQSQRMERLAAEEAKKKAEEETTQILDALDEEERRIRREALEDAKDEADRILDGFDDDMQRLQRQIEELTRANEVLQYENQGLKIKLDSANAVPVLYLGDEYEFYQGEIKDLLLSVLSDAAKTLNPKSRRQDVVRDIIRNNDYQKLSEKRAEELKRLLKNYDGMSAKLRQELEDLGFEITEEGKHYKITYFGDGRYYTVFAKTPSDFRSGKNNALSVIRTVY